MLFWGDIILKYPALIHQLPSNLLALNWGYEAGHPFNRETAQFAKARIPFYVCPGTSTWQTLMGKHDDNAFANLPRRRPGRLEINAVGYLNTDWGDGGHPQPLAVSWPLLAAGAALAWNAQALDDKTLLVVLSRDVYEDPTGKIATATYHLGFTHLKLGVKAPNETPLGTVIAAPKPEDRELFCRNGLKWFAKISRQKILATLKEIKKQRAITARSKPASQSGKILAAELDLAARMAAQSCDYMLWQQVVATGKTVAAKKLARATIKELRKLEQELQDLLAPSQQSHPAP